MALLRQFDSILVLPIVLLPSFFFLLHLLSRCLPVPVMADVYASPAKEKARMSTLGAMDALQENGELRRHFSSRNRSWLNRKRNGYIDKSELRMLLQQLSREPGRRKERARARAALAEEKKLQMVRYPHHVSCHPADVLRRAPLCLLLDTPW